MLNILSNAESFEEHNATWKNIVRLRATKFGHFYAQVKSKTQKKIKNRRGFHLSKCL